MNLSFRYQLSRDDYLALAKITCKSQYEVVARQTYWKSLFWLFILAAGAFSAYLADVIVLLFLFLCAGAGLIYDIVKVKSRFWDAIYQSLVIPKDPVELTIRDDGFHEQSDGITSFAPWETVTQWIDADQHHFIQLANRLWTIIPKTNLAVGQESLDDLLTLLETKKI